MLSDLFKITADEEAFLKRMNEGFPHLLPAFAEMAAIPPEDRLAYARKKLDDLPRSGYRLRGVPPQYVETVGEHTEASKALALDWVTSKYDIGLILEMLDIHDIAEAVVGDFTPGDKITPAEKHRLEQIAVRLIFEHNPDGKKEIWEAFEQRFMPEACIARDIEKVQVLYRSLDYERQFPQLGYAFDDFWQDDRWMSSIGRAMYADATLQRFEDVENNPEQYVPVRYS